MNLRTIKYIFFGSIILFIVYLLFFILVFHTFFVIDETEAVIDGAGTNRFFEEDIDVDTGRIYLGYTTTPALGIHDEHAVIYPKSDSFLYYLYDTAGQTERKLLYEDTNGDVSITNDLSIGGDLEVTGVMTGSLSLECSEVTIVSGEITYATYYMGVLGEGGNNDDLVTINGGSDGMIVTIFPTDSGSDIKLKDGTGNLDLNGADVTLKNLGDIIILRKHNSDWKLIFTNG